MLAKRMDHLCYSCNVVVRRADESMCNGVRARDQLVLAVHSLDEVLPRILSQHAYSGKTGLNVAKDGVSLAPFVI